MKPGELPQIRIIHLSDIHFGSKHNCIHPDSTCSSEGIPSLGKLIIDDLTDPSWAYSLWAISKEDNPDTPLSIAITGDLTERADSNEFSQAHELLSMLSTNPIIDKTTSLENLFIVPGNHDVDYTKSKTEDRFQQYCTFYNKLFSDNRNIIQPHESQSLSQVHIRPESKLIKGVEIDHLNLIKSDRFSVC